MKKLKKNNTIYEDYKNKGLVLLKSVLSEKEVMSLRKYILTRRKKLKDKNLITHSHCIKDKKICDLLFYKTITSALKKIFGGNYVINQFEIQINSFPLVRNAGLHYDAQSEKQNSYLRDKDYKFGKVGIYLQNNTNDFGGAINVISRSHKLFPIKSLLLDKWLKKFLQLFAKRVDTCRGDAIIFDSRLLHTGTSPEKVFMNNKVISQKDLEKKLKGNEKIAIYWNVTNSKYSEHYIKNSIDRCYRHEIYNSDHKYYSDHLRLFYPTDYPARLVNKCRKNNFSISTLPKKMSRLMEYIFHMN